jgi:hypothetical protein
VGGGKQEERERTQINKIRGTNGDVTTNTTEIQSIVKESVENVYSNKLET